MSVNCKGHLNQDLFTKYALRSLDWLNPAMRNCGYGGLIINYTQIFRLQEGYVPIISALFKDIEQCTWI